MKTFIQIIVLSIFFSGCIETKSVNSCNSSGNTTAIYQIEYTNTGFVITSVPQAPGFLISTVIVTSDTIPVVSTIEHAAPYDYSVDIQQVHADVGVSNPVGGTYQITLTACADQEWLDYVVTGTNIKEVSIQ
jgi:PBP1b-binding outer membrane lipoprotein LpoB